MKYAVAIGFAAFLVLVSIPALDAFDKSIDAEIALQEKQLSSEQRKNKAGTEICGNSSLIWIDDVSMSCVLRKQGASK
jgi:hypothetical protein